MREDNGAISLMTIFHSFDNFRNKDTRCRRRLWQGEFQCCDLYFHECFRYWVPWALLPSSCHCLLHTGSEQTWSLQSHSRFLPMRSRWGPYAGVNLCNWHTVFLVVLFHFLAWLCKETRSWYLCLSHFRSQSVVLNSLDTFCWILHGGRRLNCTDSPLLLSPLCCFFPRQRESVVRSRWSLRS